MKLLGMAAMGAALAAAQAPPQDMAANMQAIAQALGVSCGYCHVAQPGSGQPEPKKDIARAMIAMTRDINAKIQAATGKPAGQAASVQCSTCHHGVTIPKPLPDILFQTLREKGADAAVAQYRDLRMRYYGGQAYDFSEDTLLGVAQRVVQAKPDDAIALVKLNLEYNPQSSRSYVALAYAYTRKIDDASAIANLEKALEIDPSNSVARGQLEQLKQYQRRR